MADVFVDQADGSLFVPFLTSKRMIEWNGHSPKGFAITSQAGFDARAFGVGWANVLCVDSYRHSRLLLVTSHGMRD